MAKIKITSDSTCDISDEILKKFDIDIIPLTIILGDSERKDRVDISPNEIYEYVEKTKVLPKTAAVNAQTYADFFKKYVDEGYTVIHFNISSGASLCHDNAKKAAEQVGNVYAIDSYALSTGSGILMLYAHDLIKAGKSVEEVVAIVNEKRHYVSTSFVVENLDYLYKGGRCSGMQRFGANLLKLRPLIKMKDGKLGIGGKYRGNMRTVFAKYIEDMAKENPNYDNKRAFITHTKCEEGLVEELIEVLKKEFSFEEIYETVAGSTITSHCGKGTLGILFMTNNYIN